MAFAASLNLTVISINADIFKNCKPGVSSCLNSGTSFGRSASISVGETEAGRP